MAYSPFFINSERRRIKDKQLPELSHSLDSVRRNQWEITFYGIPDAPTGTEARPLTLAAKSVGQIGWTIDKITTRRVNDEFHYPGNAHTVDVQITFENLFRTKTGVHLYNWLKTIYNPETGEMTPGLSDRGVGSFKVTADVIELNTQGQPFTHTRLYGMWPTSWYEDERVTDANEFHTVTVTFSYDFAVKRADANV